MFVNAIDGDESENCDVAENLLDCNSAMVSHACVQSDEGQQLSRVGEPRRHCFDFLTCGSVASAAANRRDSDRHKITAFQVAICHELVCKLYRKRL